MPAHPSHVIHIRTLYPSRSYTTRHGSLSPWHYLPDTPAYTGHQPFSPRFPSLPCFPSPGSRHTLLKVAEIASLWLSTRPPCEPPLISRPHSHTTRLASITNPFVRRWPEGFSSWAHTPEGAPPDTASSWLWIRPHPQEPPLTSHLSHRSGSPTPSAPPWGEGHPSYVAHPPGAASAWRAPR